MKGLSTMPKKQVDAVFKAIDKEKKRQAEGLEMIASENYVSSAVLEAQGSILTNKYAEGYPSKRYYGGCVEIDKVETLAIERLKKLFGCKFANVQPHSGSGANLAVYFALLKPGEKVLGQSLDSGGHLTHGSKVSFSGKFYKSYSYGVDKNGYIDYDEVLKIAKRVKPKLIICGFSAYPRNISFRKFKKIAKIVGAYLLADIAHIAGLVAVGEHQTPIGIADVVTSTTHKTLRGPRGGIIMTNDKDIAKKIDKAIFPGSQGGPLEHIIAAKAVSFREALEPKFTTYIKKVVNNMKVFADAIKSYNFDLITDGTDNHLVLIDLTNKSISGKQYEDALDLAGITVNKNAIPNDKKSLMETSGIRVGVAALTSRKMGAKEMQEIAKLFNEVYDNIENKKVLESIRKDVKNMTKKYFVPGI